VNVAAPGYSAMKLPVTTGLGRPVRNGALNLLPWALLGEWPYWEVLRCRRE
jgi:hypothetical protein